MSAVAVVGVGAIGTTIAAALQDTGRHDVWLCTRGPLTELAVQVRGTSPRRYQLTCWTSPQAVPAAVEGADVVVVATKAYQTPGAAGWLARLARPGSVVAVAQNGVDQVERVGGLVPEGATVIPVIVYLPVERLAPGVVEHGGDGVLEVPDSVAGARFAALFDPTGPLRARTVADFVTTAWRKLMMNALAGGFGALTLRENAILGEADVDVVARAVLREIVAVAEAEGASFPADIIDRSLAVVVGRAGQHRSSITVDRLVGRPLEWDVRNAVIGRTGARHGIATPLNDLLTALLRVAAPAGAPDNA